jgi:IK cytokine
MRKKSFKKSFNKDDEGQQSDEEQEKSKYRDRAAERRKQDDSMTSEDQLTTEELLQRTQIEAGEELNAKQLYEQSKYLGGDVNHTHLVKGLDFALLKKVRTDINKKHQKRIDKQDEEYSEEEEEEEEEEERKQEEHHTQEMDIDDDLDQVLEKFERGENITDDTTTTEDDFSVNNKPKFHTLMAKNIFEHIQQQVNPEEQPRVELFEPGRMAFVFELADEVGHYSDAFAIPTAMIRSKTDIASKLSKAGWSEESQAESSLVIEKISQVMNRVRHGAHVESAKKLNVSTKLLNEPVAMVDDGFMGDIFADAGRDYELDESAVTAAIDETKGSYFKGLVDENEENEDQEMTEASNAAVNTLLSQATGSNIKTKEEEMENKKDTPNKRKYDRIEMDADAADIDMFGLSSSALPTSFEEHTTAYQSDDDDGNDINQIEKSATQMMDQGTNRNKKAQLTRWDFDTEDEWQNYKDNIEIHPKSAFQYGVKLGDGRKRNRERKGMNDKQRLDRDYQQVKNIMSKKYGKSLDS